MKIDHIGVAVKSIEEAKRFYEKLGLMIKCEEEVIEQQVKVAMIEIGESRIELLETLSPEGPIGKFIEKKGEGIHHLALEVNNLEEKLLNLEENGVQLIDRVPRKGADGKKIAFIHPKSTFGVLLELCEKEK